MRIYINKKNKEVIIPLIQNLSDIEAQINNLTNKRTEIQKDLNNSLETLYPKIKGTYYCIESHISKNPKMFLISER
jgi:hypothetical protein